MEIVDTISTVSSPITSLVITLDNTFIIIGCENHSVQVKSLITGSDIHELTGHNSQVNCLATSSDCERVYVACADSKLYLYDIKSRELITVLSQQEAGITDVRISSDSNFLFSSSGVIIIKKYSISNVLLFEVAKIKKLSIY
jgi:WD40 repeat protein